jgi:tetratricopeptide (TPR) repeat protein
MPSGVTPVVDPTAVGERCAEEMVDRWRAGERPLADEYLARFPDLRRHPDAGLELVAEELALRDEYRLPTTADELAARFPDWAAQVRALFDCQAALGPQLAGPAFPEPGDWLGPFRLRADLGRGSHGRVYLATQPSLADRPVVLKAGPDGGGEHLSLARLQHTHIVPLYSVHEFPDRRLRALCMPDFGGATLAAVEERLRAGGGPIADALTAAARPDPDRPAARGPAWGFLQRAAPADAVCWIGAGLADALQYAHDRGLLHLDLKPSNVLLAADGVPMLLDFHLARPPLAAGDPAPGWLGGTPGYMAPEQAAAMEAVRAGRPVPHPVDGRADVYALGLVLNGLLAAAGGRATPGLADVLARCTAADPARRYPSAGAVAVDLRRHLSDLPLRGVGNRSLWERWAKWRRRQPVVLPLALSLAGLAAGGGGLLVHADRLADRGRAALWDGRRYAAEDRYPEAAEAFRAGETVTVGLPFHAELRAELRAGRTAAERAAAADDLHAVLEKARWLAAADPAPADAVRAVGRRVREVWDRRDGLSAALTGQPTPGREERWRADLLDAAVLAADLGVRAVPPAESAAARRRALATLAEAERAFGPSGAVERERERHARALGDRETAEAAARRADALPPRTAWEHLLVGRSLLAAGDLPRATAALDRAAAGDPHPVWANYYLGVCRLRLGRPVEAAAAFSACAALAPEVGWCVANRGLAYLEAGRLDAALADFDRAIGLDPALPAAYLGRAAAHHRSGRHAEALADLRRAADAGAPAADVRYREAVVYAAQGDVPAAVAGVRACLAADPAHAGAKDLLARLTAGR